MNSEKSLNVELEDESESKNIDKYINDVEKKHRRDCKENDECVNGNENCDEDDYESMCDECKTDRAESHSDGMHDTYD